MPDISDNHYRGAMRFLENKIPPPVVAILCALAMWWVSARVPGLSLGDTARIVPAVVLAAGGLGFILVSTLALRRSRTTVNPLKPETASALVTSGIYQISRNPIYVGFALILVGWAAYLASPLALIGVVVFVLFINRFQIAPEERAMVKLFGAEFGNYRAKVRRWL